MAREDSVLDFLEPEQVRLLRQRAREQGRDVLDVLRGIVAEAVARAERDTGATRPAEQQAPRTPRRILDLAGLFGDDLQAADIDDFLYGENG